MTRAKPISQLIAHSGGSPERLRRMLLGVGFGGATPGTGPDVGGATTTIAFCSDEDIARRAESDFAALAGRSQRLAAGQDGTFSSPWTLASATVDFAARGVQSGDVIEIEPPRVVNNQATYPGPSQLLAIDSVAGMTASLRRIGLATGMGDPPSPPGGYTAPVRFVVPTLYPQVLDASKYLREVYGLDDLIYGRRTADLYDLAQFVEPCAFKVISLRYLDRARSAGKEGGDDYRAKSDAYREELQATLDRLAIHFRPIGSIPQPELTRFGMRVAR